MAKIDIEEITKTVLASMQSVLPLYQASLTVPDTVPAQLVSEKENGYTQEIEKEIICPHCGKHLVAIARNHYYRATFPPCSCGYRNDGYTSNITTEDHYEINYYIPLVFHYAGETNKSVIMRVKVTRHFEYVNGIATEKPFDIEPIAFSVITPTEIMSFKKGFDTFEKTRTHLPNLFECYAEGIRFLDHPPQIAGCQYNSNSSVSRWLAQVEEAVKNASSVKTSAKAVQAPTITPYSLTIPDITDLYISVENKDNITGDTDAQIWCTKCDEIFNETLSTEDIEEKGFVHKYYRVRCPRCGQEKVIRTTDISCYQDVVAVFDTADFYIVQFLRGTIRNWNAATTHSSAAAISKKNGKVFSYKWSFSQRAWERGSCGSRSATTIISPRLILQVKGTGLEEIINAREMLSSNGIVRYISAYVKNPDIANSVKEPGMAELIFSSCEKKTGNVTASSKEEMLGIPDELTKWVSDEKVDLNKVKALYSLNLSCDNIKWAVKENIEASSIKRLTDIGIEINDIIRYLKKVDEEQALKPEKSIPLWRDYLENCLVSGSDMTDKNILFPGYLHTEFDISLRRAEKIFGSAMNANAEKYKYLNFCNNKIRLTVCNEKLWGKDRFYFFSRSNEVANGDLILLWLTTPNEDVITGAVLVNKAGKIVETFRKNNYRLLAKQKQQLEPWMKENGLTV